MTSSRSCAPVFDQLEKLKMFICSLAMLQTDTRGIEVEFLVHTTNPIIDGIPGVPKPVVRNRLLFCVGEARLLQKVTVFFIKKIKKNQ